MFVAIVSEFNTSEDLVDESVGLVGTECKLATILELESHEELIAGTVESELVCFLDKLGNSCGEKEPLFISEEVAD